MASTHGICEILCSVFVVLYDPQFAVTQLLITPLERRAPTFVESTGHHLVQAQKTLLCFHNSVALVYLMDTILTQMFRYQWNSFE